MVGFEMDHISFSQTGREVHDEETAHLISDPRVLKVFLFPFFVGK